MVQVKTEAVAVDPPPEAAEEEAVVLQAAAVVQVKEEAVVEKRIDLREVLAASSGFVIVVPEEDVDIGNLWQYKSYLSTRTVVELKNRLRERGLPIILPHGGG